MSTSFTTKPALTYDQVLASGCLVAEAPERPVYARRRHTFLKSGSGLPAGRITLVEGDGGGAEFERFGSQCAELLLLLAEEYGVQVFDEHGLRYPEESDG